jgi:hypothetical protein
MSRIKKCLFYFFGFGLSILFTLIFLEFALRFLPVIRPFDRTGGVSADETLRYLPNQRTVFSQGKFFDFPVTKVTNNYGFVSEREYVKGSNPSVVVIGDSYVEAMQVPYQRSIAGKLEELMAPSKVYSIGVSGAPLSQYLHYAEYAKREFSPEAFVFVIVGNDFDESLCGVKPQRGFYCFNEQMSLVLSERGEGLLRAAARKSSLIRYLVFHLNLDWRRLFSSFCCSKAQFSTPRLYVANTESKKSDAIVEGSKKAVNEFFYLLKKTVETTPVFFIIDADRELIYSGEKDNQSFFEQLRETFLEEAEKLSFPVVDLHQVFLQSFKIHGDRFEFLADGHWNEKGHQLAAEAVFRTINFGRVGD